MGGLGDPEALLSCRCTDLNDALSLYLPQPCRQSFLDTLIFCKTCFHRIRPQVYSLFTIYDFLQSHYNRI